MHRSRTSSSEDIGDKLRNPLTQARLAVSHLLRLQDRFGQDGVARDQAELLLAEARDALDRLGQAVDQVCNTLGAR